MSRFGNLELGREHEDHSHDSARQPLKGEAHFLAEAQGAFENGNFESALRLFAKVLEFNPQNPAAWTGQVRMLIELGEFQEARLWADKALGSRVQGRLANGQDMEMIDLCSMTCNTILGT